MTKYLFPALLAAWLVSAAIGARQLRHEVTWLSAVVLVTSIVGVALTVLLWGRERRTDERAASSESGA